MTGTAGGLNPLDEQAIEELVTQATSAIAHTETLDELKAVRLEFMGDSAALVQANRGIGKLDPKDRGLAGRLLGSARSQINAALQERQELLQERHDAQVLVSEAVDITIPTARARAGDRFHGVPLLGRVRARRRRSRRRPRDPRRPGSLHPGDPLPAAPQRG